jgi:uncharacterized protein YkwD
VPATPESKAKTTPTSEPTAPTSSGGCPGATLRPNSHDLTAVADATICLINSAREKQHLGELTPNEDLDSAAQLHSHEMHVDRFFSHVDPSGKDQRAQVLASGYGAHANGVASAQCVAWGTGRWETPHGTVLSWMESPSHKALLLSSKYHEVGIGVTPGNDKDGSSGALYTADLASRHLDH